MHKKISNNKFSISGMIDLAQPRLGSKIIFKSDDFFAPVDRIISPNEPIWRENYYNENGKWMDGWETRRRRNKGHDYLIIRLGRKGRPDAYSTANRKSALNVILTAENRKGGASISPILSAVQP